jgi:hypothetical protein
VTAEELQALVEKFRTLDRSDPEWIKAIEILDKLGLLNFKQQHIAQMKARGEMILPDRYRA